MAPPKFRAHFFSAHRSSASQSETSSQPDSILTSPSAASLQAPSPSSSASEQVAENLKTKDHICTELDKVQDLRKLHAPALSTDQKNRIDRTIADTAEAIQAVAVLLEPTRIELEVRDRKLSMMGLLRWKYQDSQRVIPKMHQLLNCYSRLIPEMSELRQLDVSQSLPPSGRFELEAAVPPSAALQTRNENIILAEPFPGELAASPVGGEMGFVVERSHQEKILGLGANSLDPGTRKPDDKKTGGAGTVDDEMDDLLAWRRSRNQVATETKQSFIYIPPGLNTDA